MIKVTMFTIYDSKAETYSEPFGAQNSASATRSWTQAVNDGKCIYSKNPEDFTLFECGVFDCTTGVFTPHKALKSIVCALNLVQVSPVPGRISDLN